MAAETGHVPLADLPGTYALILRAERNETVCIGRLGNLRLRPGFYLYVGSALGPGGLRRRVARHLRTQKRLHWHIDYLLACTDVREVWWTADPARRECAWSAAIGRIPGAETPLPGFGSSDCRCRSHLFYFSSLPPFAALRAAPTETGPNRTEPERLFPKIGSTERG